jgi:hypothetical protein
VSIQGDLIAAGAPADFTLVTPTEAGAVYLFERNQGGSNQWGQMKKLTASDSAAGDGLGFALAIGDDLLITSAPFEDGEGDAKPNAGAVYLFSRNEGGSNLWSEVEKLTASDAEAGDFLGVSVTIDGDLLVAGANADGGAGEINSAGAAYVFRHNAGADDWAETDKLSASGPVDYLWLGTSVGIGASGLIVAGAPNGEAPGPPAVSNSGTVYVFCIDQFVYLPLVRR